MAVTPEQIEQYFKDLDWPFFRREERLWDSGYSGDSYRFRFFVRLTERWLYVTWLFPVTIEAECRPNLYDHMLRLSYQMNGAKVMLDNDDDLVITVEFPCGENLSVSQFEAALRGVCWNVDQHFLELVRIARDTNAVSSLKPTAGDGEARGQTPPDAPDHGIDWSG